MRVSEFGDKLVETYYFQNRKVTQLGYLVALFIQVGKGRDVGLNQIATFEAKVASGNGEQALARDLYRLGQLLDFPRMLSFFFTSVGFYVTTMVYLNITILRIWSDVISSSGHAVLRNRFLNLVL